ncbi:unnamed protein product [Ilex paraguariensis]|uniref:Uncharacterized protein n=1 Tax=Ilex paraguariensis TaxID=185542 RepID=A0ABC8T194_9AQUA
MVMLCFVLDLRSLSPPLLRDLKQSLLQLANFYAISTPINDRTHSKPLRDRIGLCYVFKSRISGADELKVAYNPRGNFSLRDFHDAVNNLPTDAFAPELNTSGALCCDDVKLSTVLSDEILYSWGVNEKDITRKVIMISSCLVENLDPVTRKTLMDAADKCISVEFVLLEQMSNHLGDTTQNINSFVKQICYLENCSFRGYLPVTVPVIGVITKTCRCHGIPLNDAHGKNIDESSSCPVTGNYLEEFDLIENSVKVGEKTVLFMPSSQCSLRLRQVSSSVDFNIIERTNLGSLSEVFQGLSTALHSLDQGLVCSSNCNIEPVVVKGMFAGRSSSGDGWQRIAGSEEVLPVPDVSQLIESTVSKEIEHSVRAALLKEWRVHAFNFSQMEVGDYNPVLHERGFHQILNSLLIGASEMSSQVDTRIIKFDALMFFIHKSIPPKLKELTLESNLVEQDSSEEAVPSKQATDAVVIEEQIPQLDVKMREDKTNASITEEWERLIVSEVPKIHSPTCIFRPKLDQPVVSPPEGTRQLDEKTSRILERLEVPRQLKTKITSPIVSSSVSVETKRPLVPVRPIIAADQGTTASQPIKPNFQRLKRKQR